MKRGISDTLALTTDTKMKEIIRALWRNIIIEKINVKWHPDGIIFSEDVDNPNIITFTSGVIFIHIWNELSRAQIAVLGNENYHPERRWTVEGATVTLGSDEIFYIYAKVPIDEEETVATLVFSTDYTFEEFYPGYINILMGIINVPSPDRVFSMLWNGVTYIPRALPVIATRYVETGNHTCQAVDGYNTGFMIVETKQQFRTGADNWQDTDPQVLSSFLADSGGTCSVLLLGLWISVGPDYDAWNAAHEFEMTYSEYTQIAGNSLIEPGMNYLYYSVPANKTVQFLDADDHDITSHFGVIGTDVREGYHDNNIYRLDVAFGTSTSVVFKLVIRPS